jgi:hypothetical protein
MGAATRLGLAHAGSHQLCDLPIDVISEFCVQL